MAVYFGLQEGPWSRVQTAFLDDPDVPSADFSAAVQPWTNLPPIGESAMDATGDLYFTSLKDNDVYRRDVSGTITRLIRNSRLDWADAPSIASNGPLWLPVAQLDRNRDALL